MNLVLFFLSVILVFTTMILIDKWFPKYGIVAWMCVATITANILVCKSVEMFGFVCSLGNVMFASVFLSTDIINEKYGVSLSRKAVALALVCQIAFTSAMQFGLAYIPSSVDLANESMSNLFALNLRTSIASVAMFGVGNYLGIWIHQQIKKRIKNKMWLRNNVSTIVSNSVENFLFVFLAFWGLMGVSDILSIAITTTVIECIIAVCDTPFLYWAVKSEKGR